MKVDCAIIGGGIVGLSVALHLARRQAGLRVAVLEKESQVASHQTGRNSGVIHSGIYYAPGSLKALYARDGNRSMIAFCREYAIPHEVCGKVIVATSANELPLLEALHERGLENHLTVHRLSPEAVREIEPHVRCLAGLSVPSTAIVDYRDVCARLVRLFADLGGSVQMGTEVQRIHLKAGRQILETNIGEVDAAFFVNCGGLQSDRIAREAGAMLDARITPFRGEYFELIPERTQLVRTLIYPVPDPAFPFLGVHFTKMIDGSVHAGPNAVLAWKREGYRKTDLNFGDALETLTYRGFWNLARKHYREGFAEMYRSWSKAAFVKSLQRLIPEIEADDLVPAKSGVRAQALSPDGNLVNDFLLIERPGSIHVCNAPSPAATSALEIGQHVAGRIPPLKRRSLVTFAHA